MARFYKVGKLDYVAIDRITNFVVHKRPGKNEGDPEVFVLCCFVDYGYGKNIEENALYIISEHETEAEAEKALIQALGVCGGAVTQHGEVVTPPADPFAVVGDGKEENAKTSYFSFN